MRQMGLDIWEGEPHIQRHIWLISQTDTQKTSRASFTSITSASTATFVAKRLPIISSATTTADILLSISSPAHPRRKLNAKKPRKDPRTKPSVIMATRAEQNNRIRTPQAR